jgi:iron complex outermembrane receptor protein
MSKEEIAKNNLGQDIPFLLQNSPSVIVNSDAGAGVGYTGINIRGSDATRINVTVNGIPINDSESHGMYWVNMPDLASSVENIQVQRGVGTSTNGAAAFGASINIQTAQLNVKPYAEISNSYGSFNTWKHTIKAGSGLLADHFTVDARLSKVSSNGYMDRATSDLKSYYLSAGYYGKNTMLRFVNFSGKEKTYQSWYGVLEDSLATNRTYNYYTYENETDNYQQDHYQLLFSQVFHRTFRFNAALHYTRGRGYYEQFRDDDSFADYGLSDVITGNDTITTSDFIRQRWLDNHFFGLTYSFEYNNGKHFSAILGGGANQYNGKHFGTVIWAQNASNSSINHRYYDNDAAKTDVNVYLKANYRIGNNLNAFVDLQYRSISYSFLGYNNLLQNVEQQAAFNFFNPKAGLVLEINGSQHVYASYSRGNREPVRDDFTNSTPDSRPKAETLNNVEAGYKLNGKNFRFGVTYYLMSYQNQLVLTGQINDVGAYTRTNINQSYRTGIEPEFEVSLAKIVTLGGNFTYSMNKIKLFTEFVDNFDTGIQEDIIHNNTDIAFSPNIIASGTVGVQPLNGLDISLISKYAGKQYLDNTSDNSRSIDAYFTQNVRINYIIKTKVIREIGINLLLNNIFNAMYEANGYTFSYVYGGEKITENYYYPMAGFNFLTGLTFKF